MTIQEQEIVKTEGYTEAMRYMRNAEDTLKKAGRGSSDRFFKDKKYVRTACGTAYNGVLIALITYLEANGIEGAGKKRNSKKLRQSIDYFRMQVRARDGKLLDTLNAAYDILHLDGYYDGRTDVDTIRSGFKHAYEIIDLIKPAEGVGAKK